MLGLIPSSTRRELSRTLSARSLSPQLQLTTQIRLYASRNKSKANKVFDSEHTTNVKGSHAASTKNLIPASERAFLDDGIQADYDKTSAKMSSTIEWLRKEVAGIIARGTGHVSTSMVDGVKVALSDEKKEMRLNEIATIGIRDGNCIIVTLHDDSYFKLAEKAIYAAKIPSVVPQKHDARTIKIVIPRPTMEARAALLQVAAKTAEEARVQLRNNKDIILRKYKWKSRSPEAEQFQKLCDLKLKIVESILNKAKEEFSK